MEHTLLSDLSLFVDVAVMQVQIEIFGNIFSLAFVDGGELGMHYLRHKFIETLASVDIEVLGVIAGRSGQTLVLLVIGVVASIRAFLGAVAIEV